MRDILDRPEQVLNLMREIAEAEILPRFRMLKDHEIDEKGPDDLVTIADRDSERAFCEKLPKLLKGSVILGEEGYHADRSLLKHLGRDAPVWVVDPVDGTRNFVHGKSPFTVILALVKNRETLGGWIFDPGADESVYAQSGGGAYHRDKDGNERRLKTAPTGMGSAKLPVGEKIRPRLQWAVSRLGLEMPKMVGRYRCAGREYMDMALGKLDFARYGGMLKPWDHAAGCLIVREAGGKANYVKDDTPYQVGPKLMDKVLAVSANNASWGEFRDIVVAADDYGTR